MGRETGAAGENDPYTARLAKSYSAVVHDVMRGMGLKDFTLPPEIRPIQPGPVLAGPVYTLDGKVDTSADPHETLLEWTGFLSKAKLGHVVICQPGNAPVALMGELSAETLQGRGVLGYIADGGCRDVSFIERLGFPVYCRFFTPRDIVGTWLPKGLDVPITIGPVTVHPGDYVIADHDGICVIPRNHVAEVVEAAEAAANTENTIRDAIRAGMDPQEAYLKYGKF